MLIATFQIVVCSGSKIEKPVYTIKKKLFFSCWQRAGQNKTVLNRRLTKPSFYSTMKTVGIQVYKSNVDVED